MIEFEEKNVKKIRTIKVFIDAAATIIEEEGIENVTIREVAKIAGYNSATIYNYFDNSNQLIFFAAARFMKEYIEEMPEYIEDAENELEKLILMWECFCFHSFSKPKIYYAIFADDIGGRPGNLLENYFRIFPEDLNQSPPEYIPMLRTTELPARTSMAMQPVIEEGHISEDIAPEIDERIRFVYQGMLSLIINKRMVDAPRENTRRIMKHIQSIFNYGTEIV